MLSEAVLKGCIKNWNDIRKKDPDLKKAETKNELNGFVREMKESIVRVLRGKLFGRSSEGDMLFDDETVFRAHGLDKEASKEGINIHVAGRALSLVDKVRKNISGVNRVLSDQYYIDAMCEEIDYISVDNNIFLEGPLISGEEVCDRLFVSVMRNLALEYGVDYDLKNIALLITKTNFLGDKAGEFKEAERLEGAARTAGVLTRLLWEQSGKTA